MTSELPPIPSTKPPYRSFLIGEDGRVWVRRPVTAERLNEAEPGTPERPPTGSWVEPSVYDVFEPDGTYLGEARVPRATTLMKVRGESAWGTRQGEAGEIYVVRLQVDRGAGSEARD